MERVPEKVRAADGEKLTGYDTELTTLSEQAATLTKFQ